MIGLTKYRKTILLMLVCALPLFGVAQLSQKSETKPKYAPGKEKHLNKTDELGRKQGTWSVYNRDGEKVAETDWVNDKKEGVEKKYYSFNKIKEEQEYLGGMKEGQYTRYFFSGQAATEGQYVNGKRDGKWTRYFEDGSTRQEGDYKAGKKNGQWKTYNRKGEIVNTTIYTAPDADAPQQPTEPKKTPPADKKISTMPIPPTNNNQPLYPKGAPADTTKK